MGRPNATHADMAQILDAAPQTAKPCAVPFRGRGPRCAEMRAIAIGVRGPEPSAVLCDLTDGDHHRTIRERHRNPKTV